MTSEQPASRSGMSLAHGGSQGQLLRLSWLFANVLVIGSDKSHCIVYERVLVFYALLRHFYYALGNHFARDPRVRGPGELTPRLLDLAPRFIESRRKYYRCRHLPAAG
jgi:hypothetical protein